VKKDGEHTLLQPDDIDDFKERYEQLRSHVVDSPECYGHVAGFGVFLRQGMIGWMLTCPVRREVRTDSTPLVSPDTASLRGAAEGELIGMLAGILLNHRQKEV
jgi:hypothetical protein